MSSVEGGYECDFVNEVPEDLICVVCQLALKDPLQIADCGHRLCKTCFNQLKDHAESRHIAFLCPLDREVIDTTQVFIDKAVTRKVLNLTVHCFFKEKKCFWTGELRNLQKHEENCPKNPSNASYVAKDLDEILSRMDQQETAIAAKNQEIEECKIAIERLHKTNENLQKTIENLTTRLEICENNISHDKEKKEALLTKTEFQRVTYVWLVPVQDLKLKEQFSSSFYVGSESLCFKLGMTNVFGSLSVGLYRCRRGGDGYFTYLNRVNNFEFRIFILGPDGRVEQRHKSCNSNSGYFSIGEFYDRSLPLCLSSFNEEDPQFRNLFYDGRLQIHCEIKPLIEL